MTPVSARRLTAIGAVLPVLLITGCSASAVEPEPITVRLWDAQVADAYRDSLAEFTAETGIEVIVVTTPWSEYWTQLRADLAAGQADDLFWVNAANFEEYAAAGLLVEVDERAHDDEWDAGVVAQYTRDERLWGVPQLVDPGIGILYNSELLDAAGITPAALEALEWDPSATGDSLRETARMLTVDAAGSHPGDPGFDESRVRSHGYGASNDLNATLLQFLAGNGAAWQKGDTFVFDSAPGIEAIQYAADLVGAGYAPPAAETNPPGGSDHLLEEFLGGRLALFQTGAYNLSNVDEGASFDWGIASIPEGPTGRISVTNGIVLAGWSGSDRAPEQLQVMQWLGSAEGARPLGASGAALPAVLAAQNSYFSFWSDRGVDVGPMIDVLRNGTIQPPQGQAYAAAQTAYEPILNDVFLGARTAAEAVPDAADAANRAVEDADR